MISQHILHMQLICAVHTVAAISSFEFEWAWNEIPIEIKIMFKSLAKMSGFKSSGMTWS